MRKGVKTPAATSFCCTSVWCAGSAMIASAVTPDEEYGGLIFRADTLTWVDGGCPCTYNPCSSKTQVLVLLPLLL